LLLLMKVGTWEHGIIKIKPRVTQVLHMSMAFRGGFLKI